MNRQALHKLSYGIYVLTTKVDGTPFGCIINTAFQITSQPPRIAVSCNRDNYTHDKIMQAEVFALSVLSENCDAGIIRTFGYSSGRDTDKFRQVEAADSKSLALPQFPENSVAVLECRVVDKLEVGTHTVFVGELVDCDASRPDALEMTYRYYHEIRKGSAPRNAPTFLAEEPAGPAEPSAVERWKCSVCGYIYEEDKPFADLADDWVCPVCGANKDAFTKLA